MGLRVLFSLERPQEIDDLLLLLSAQLVEAFDDPIRLAATAPVISDGVYQVGGSSVMEEEDTLSNAPEGSCPELVGSGAALRDAVGKAFTHVVDEKVREETCRLIGECSTRPGGGTTRNHFARGKRGCMTLGAAYLREGAASTLTGRCGGSRGGWGKHPHEVGKRFDV